MKATGNSQQNTRTYWNWIYTTPAKEKDYWSPTGRFPQLVKLVKNGDRFLDVGCGVGIPCRDILKEKKDCEVWGVDISDRIIEANKRDEPRGKWFQGYSDNFSFLPQNYFDIVFAGELIEHIDSPDALFREAYKVLKMGGKLAITTPIENAVDSPEHIWIFDKDDVERLFVGAGFKNVKFMGLPDMEHLVVFFAVGIK